MSFTIFFIIFLITAGVSFSVSFLAWKRRKEHAAIELCRVMFFTALYAFLMALEAASQTVAEKIFWSKVSYIGAVTVPVLYFIFIMRYTGHAKVTSTKNTILLFILPLITLILAWTNEYHHLIWSGFSPISPITNLLVYYHGIWFFTGYMAYDYILLLFATISLYNFIIRHKNIFRRRGWELFIAGIFPWIAGVLYVTKMNFIPGFEMTSVLTGLSGIFLIHAIIETDFFDLVPIARETLVETLQDGIIVLDAKNRIQDINGAACIYLGISGKKVQGLSVELCGISSELLLNALISPENIDQLEIIDKQEVMIFSFIKREIKKEIGSRLVVVRDISEQVAIHKEILAGEERYKKMYNLFRLMADNMSDMLWAKDLDKKFIFVNRAICEDMLHATDIIEPIGKTDLFFKDREQMSHSDILEWHNIGKVCQDTDDKVILSGKSYHSDELGSINGEVRYLDVQKAPIYDEKGLMIGIVGSARDVTKQKIIEQEIFKRDKLLSAITKSTSLLIQGEIL